MPVYESLGCRGLVTEAFPKICSQVLAQKFSRSPHIHSALLKILPRLAAFNTPYFVKKYISFFVFFFISMHDIFS